MASKPKVAVFDFACCEGCQLQFYNLEEDLINLLGLIEPVEWREAMSDKSSEYDIAIIEGSITRPEDEERLKEIRAKAKILIALGACAINGGVNLLKNQYDFTEVRKIVYNKDALANHLETAKTKGVGEIVQVDAIIPGCPIDPVECTTILKELLKGKIPALPRYPVCVECKKKGNICRYEYNEVCLGPVIKAGCQARCPSHGSWCFGCRGLAEEPNVEAACEVMNYYGKTANDLKDRLMLFNYIKE